MGCQKVCGNSEAWTEPNNCSPCTGCIRCQNVTLECSRGEVELRVSRKSNAEIQKELDLLVEVWLKGSKEQKFDMS